MLIEAKAFVRNSNLKYQIGKMRFFILLLSFYGINSRYHGPYDFDKNGPYYNGEGPPFPSYYTYKEDLDYGFFDGKWTEDMRVPKPGGLFEEYGDRNILTDARRGR